MCGSKRLEIDEKQVPVLTDADKYFEPRTREFVCSWTSSAGTREEAKISSSLNYWGICTVTKANMAHAAMLHPTQVRFVGKTLPKDCQWVPQVVAETSDMKSIGRDSTAVFTVKAINFHVDTIYAGYNK